MKEYILDTSVVVQELITDIQTLNVHALFQQADKDDVFYVPEFCLLECTNVLWKQVRFAALPQ
jgi:predicted nucleic acid-binding protein